MATRFDGFRRELVTPGAGAVEAERGNQCRLVALGIFAPARLPRAASSASTSKMSSAT